MKTGLIMPQTAPTAAFFAKPLGSVTLPSSFATPQAALDPVVDQGCCGSCYAVAVSHCFNDRLITTDRRVHYNSLLTLYGDAFMGCNGGLVFGTSFEHVAVKQGMPLVTRAEFEKIKAAGDCVPPAQQSECSQSVAVRSRDMASYCRGNRSRSTLQFCFDGWYFTQCATTHIDAVQRVRTDRWLTTVSEQRIQEEVKDHGSVVFTIAVTPNFMDTSSPSWRQVDKPVGSDYHFTKAYCPTVREVGSQVSSYHAVTVVGWATLTEAEASGIQGLYWVVRNSWGTDWGDDGYCLVAAGSVVPGDSDRVVNVFVPGSPKVNDKLLVAAFPQQLSFAAANSAGDGPVPRDNIDHRWVAAWIGRLSVALIAAFVAIYTAFAAQ